MINICYNLFYNFLQNQYLSKIQDAEIEALQTALREIPKLADIQVHQNYLIGNNFHFQKLLVHLKY
jgi:hypothetical protein